MVYVAVKKKGPHLTRAFLGAYVTTQQQAACRFGGESPITIVERKHTKKGGIHPLPCQVLAFESQATRCVAFTKAQRPQNDERQRRQLPQYVRDLLHRLRPQQDGLVQVIVLRQELRVVARAGVHVEHTASGSATPPRPRADSRSRSAEALKRSHRCRLTKRCEVR
jgi:hypothetical protein